MIYGKLNNEGQFIKAPLKITYQGFVYYNPSGTILKNAGYYALIEEPRPMDGEYYQSVYTQEDEVIRLSWEEVEPITAPEVKNEYITPTAEDLIVKMQSYIEELENKVEFLLDHVNCRHAYEEQQTITITELDEL